MEKKQIVSKLENESPGLLEELLCRRRFTHASKNTSKALKDVEINKLEMLLHHVFCLWIIIHVNIY